MAAVHPAPWQDRVPGGGCRFDQLPRLIREGEHRKVAADKAENQILNGRDRKAVDHERLDRKWLVQTDLSADSAELRT